MITLKHDPHNTNQKSGLGLFIKTHMPDIIAEWSAFAKTRTPASDNMSALGLRDHIEEILTFIVQDMDTPQTSREQEVKSQGNAPEGGQFQRSAAEVHAALRLSDGFDIDQMVSEYRALRASTIKLWLRTNNLPSPDDVIEITRFNEAVDQAMTESISYYTKSIEKSRSLFLGILGHDLRNPVGAASQLAELIVKKGSLDERQSMFATQIVNSTQRAMRIIENLLDLTRTSFGSELPITRTRFDIGALAEEIIQELDALHPGHEIVLKSSGDMQVALDEGRMGQIFSNLIGNAIQYGYHATPIHIGITRNLDNEIVITVLNLGDPIPGDKAEKIFDSLVRADETEHQSSANMGLGLYITKKIVMAHGGTIDVTSDMNGTEFVIRLPQSGLSS